jgi:protein tyrosine/serine phosphatase
MRPLQSITALVFLLLSLGCTTVGRTEGDIHNFDQVSPTLYRGSEFTSIATLQKYNIKTVIDLRDQSHPHEANLLQDAGIAYRTLPQDPSKIGAHDAEQFLQLLAAAESPTFVHCTFGRDRTGLAIAAYRIRILHCTEQQALDDLLAHGHQWLLFPNIRAAVHQVATASALN